MNVWYVYEWMNKWMKEWINEWMDGWMDWKNAGWKVLYIIL